MKQPIILGVSGDTGSFSEEAGLLYTKREGLTTTLKYLIDMENVLQAVEDQTIDLGIFPVVNKRGGLVSMAFTAMGNHYFKMIDELWLEVNQCLLALPNTRLDDITKVASHPQGLAQCQRFLQTKLSKAQQIKTDDTAQSARALAASQFDANTAVIASAHAAKLFGLEIIAKNIQDETPNTTAFIIVSKR